MLHLEVDGLEDLPLVGDHHDVLGAECEHEHVLPRVVHHLRDLVQEVSLGPHLATVTRVLPGETLLSIMPALRLIVV